MIQARLQIASNQKRTFLGAAATRTRSRAAMIRRHALGGLGDGPISQLPWYCKAYPMFCPGQVTAAVAADVNSFGAGVINTVKAVAQSADQHLTQLEQLPANLEKTAGKLIEQAKDAAGNTIQRVSDGAGNIIHYVFDSSGRLIDSGIESATSGLALGAAGGLVLAGGAVIGGIFLLKWLLE